MTAKQYLKSIRALDTAIIVKNDELIRLRLQIEQITPQASNERVLGSATNDAMRTVDRIVDLQAEINAEIEKIVDLKSEARQRINSLDDERYSKLLIEYYINHKTLEQAAEAIGYCDRHARRLHGYALTAFSNKYPVL